MVRLNKVIMMEIRHTRHKENLKEAIFFFSLAMVFSQYCYSQIKVCPLQAWAGNRCTLPMIFSHFVSVSLKLIP